MKNGKVVVVQLIPWISEGGAETLVKDYAVNIDKRRFDIHILTSLMSSVTSSNLLQILQADVDVLSPYKWGGSSLLSKIVRYIGNFFKSPRLEESKRANFIKQNILRLQPDVIHVHMQMLKYLYPIADLLGNTRLYYTCHSLPHRYFNEDTEKDEFEAAKYLIKHNGLKLVALHNGMRVELNKMFGVDNTIVLRNCVNFARFKDVEESKEDIRMSLNVPTDSFVLGHVGRFSYIKNHKYIVEIFKKLIVRRPNSFLLLIGSGCTKKEIVQMLNECGLYNKSLILPARGDIPRMMKAMDVFVLPSLFEGLSIVTIEAQVSGLRTIVSSQVPEDVLFSENALSLDINVDPQVWVNAIVDTNIKGTVYNDIKNYDVENVMRTVEQLYSNVK